MKSTKEDLRSLIAQEEARVARLNSERKESCERLNALRRELEAAIRLQVPGSHVSAVNYPSGPISDVEKVALFRSLFHGRDDVFGHQVAGVVVGQVARARGEKAQPCESAEEDHARGLAHHKNDFCSPSNCSPSQSVTRQAVTSPRAL